MTNPLDAVDAGLLTRFRAAGGQIRWRPVAEVRGTRPSGPAVRIAHLNDEEARVESHGASPWVTDSGPLGALVLLLEIDRRSGPVQLISRDAGTVHGFPQGAIEARWPPSSEAGLVGPTIRDLVGLARYALA